MDSFVERHLTSGVHAAHVGAEVLSPCRLGIFLSPAGGLQGLLMHPLYWSRLLIVWQTLQAFFRVVNSRTACRISLGYLQSWVSHAIINLPRMLYRFLHGCTPMLATLVGINLRRKTHSN